MDDCLNRKSGKYMADKIAAHSHVKLHECYQCGKCSAGCPMAHAMDLMPREIVHYMQLGMMDDILKSKTIWLCASCHTCSQRCPHSIDIPALIENARIEAKKKGLIAVKEVDRFTDIFLENVKIFGKNQEVVLEGAYNVSTGHFMQDMINVPHMLTHKLIGPQIHVVRDRRHVRDIMITSMKGGTTK